MKNRVLIVIAATLALVAGLTSVSFANADNASKNTEVVTAFYETVFTDRNIEEGISKYMGTTYKQHNPYVADGPEGFRNGITYYLNEVMPKAKYDVIRTIAENDLVTLHVRVSQPGKPDIAIVDIFRVENDRVVEHWDVSQEVPAKQAHTNTMF